VPKRRRAKPKCGQPMPNAHGEPSGHVTCTLARGHALPHVCATDYVMHTWQPPAPGEPVAPKPTPAAPKPKPAAAKPPPKRKPPAKRRPRRRRRRSQGWPAPVREVVLPIFGLGLAGAAVHVLALTLPHLA
jgi:hypothetical protein